MNKYCAKCGLYKSIKNPCILGRGDDFDIDILVIGEGPGKYEDAVGKPFVGDSGKLLQESLNCLNARYYITNAVKCRSIDSTGANRTPTAIEIDCCKPFTIKQIIEKKPKVILAVGSIAVEQLLGFTMAMEVMRGKVFYHPYFNCNIIPTYHPAFILRNMEEPIYREHFNDDILKAQEIAFATPPRRIIKHPSTLINPVDIERYLKDLCNEKDVAIDLETTGLNPRKDKITDISFCSSLGRGVHIDWNDVLPHIDLLKKFLLSDVKKIGHNFIFDHLFLRLLGLKINNIYFDTELAYHLMTMSYEGGKSRSLYKLKVMSWQMTSDGGHDSVLNEYGGIVGLQNIKNLKKKKKPRHDPDIQVNKLFEEKEPDPVPEESTFTGMYTDEELDKYYNFISNEQKKELLNFDITPKQYYSAMDADVTYRIYKYLKPDIDKDFNEIFYNLVMPLSATLARIMENGIMLDFDHIDKMKERFILEMGAVRDRFVKAINYDFNLNSTQQLAEVLKTKLKVKINKDYSTPKGAPSVNEEALKFYSKSHPVLEDILTYRGYMKSISTYFEGYRELADESNHRIYPEYTQIGTATGRLSCSNPSLHTIPKKNEIRNMIVPRKGWKLIVADQSQVELRVLAQIANDENMINAFKSGMDFHAATACAMFNIAVEEFNKNNPKHAEARSNSKAINFGIVYLESARSLADSLKIPISEAEKFMNKFFSAYPNVKKWMNDSIAFARKFGYVETIYGRRRYLPNIHSSIDYIREGAERQACNTRIQSPASDITAISLIRIQENLDKNKNESLIVGSVHDSILVESPPDEVDELIKTVPELMTKDIPKITIPLVADVEVVDRWNK